MEESWSCFVLPWPVLACVKSASNVDCVVVAHRPSKQSLGGRTTAKKLEEIFGERDAKIRELAAAGVRKAEIALQFGVSRQRVYQIVGDAA